MSDGAGVELVRRPCLLRLPFLFRPRASFSAKASIPFLCILFSLSPFSVSKNAWFRSSSTAFPKFRPLFFRQYDTSKILMVGNISCKMAVLSSVDSDSVFSFGIDVGASLSLPPISSIVVSMVKDCRPWETLVESVFSESRSPCQDCARSTESCELEHSSRSLERLLPEGSKRPSPSVAAPSFRTSSVLRASSRDVLSRRS